MSEKNKNTFNLRQLIREVFYEDVDRDVFVGRIVDSVYRSGSTKYFELIRAARQRLIEGVMLDVDEIDRYYLESTDLGELAEVDGMLVPLDFPMLNEEFLVESEKRVLNKPSRSSGPKKYKVYVRNKKGNVVQVNFGDAKGGLTAKMQDSGARNSFVARHNCEEKNDKTKAGYWSCRLPRYWKELGLKKNSYRFW